MTLLKDWLRDRSCGNCNSFQLDVGDTLAPTGNVRCRTCRMVLGTWRDFVSAAEEVCERAPSERRAGSSKPRSTTVDVWSKLKPWPGKRLRRGSPARAGDQEVPVLDVGRQTEARRAVSFEFP